MDNKKPFKEETLRTKFFVITTVTLLIIGAIAFVIAAFYFGILGLFSLLGVEYNSFWSLLWFVLSYFLLAIIGDSIIKLCVTIMRISEKWNHTQIKISFLIFSFLINWATISLLDELFNSIELKVLTEIILSLIIAILDLASETKAKK
ncbi:Regulatory protein YrvL [Paenibacillus uliginis N3/975]|uniref:Regulatory protein YrvL n=1 Tax=Paenibacillus uliginis N3/975 TaxID=1313296 RepID=A0A1X7HQF2_9BACL|nr:YrvL family regulatory protein [Paenibacillus uliginis]SMF90074.1 Regulatory protein YrvL [Paenibacillus uliginis N3/975]